MFAALVTALEIATGKVITDLRKSHAAADFHAFLNKANQQVPPNSTCTDPRQPVHPQDPSDPSMAAAPQAVHFHFTPTYRSWMNMVERCFAAPTTKKLQGPAHRSPKALTTDIRARVQTWNQDPKPFTWHKTTEEIPDPLASYCTTINK